MNIYAMEDSIQQGHMIENWFCTRTFDIVSKPVQIYNYQTAKHFGAIFLVTQ